jgi:hypothetical protein
MGDRDAEHTLTELQEARAEIDRLRELLRWREVGKEFPEESGAYIVANKTNCFMDYYSKTVKVWSSKYYSHWRPIGLLPGEVGE